MSIRAAIEWLRAIKDKYIKGGDEGFDQKRREAIDTAITALKKQIPKKPTEDVLGYRCPVCGKPVWGLVSRMNYCGECGNKMDWENEHDGE